ncbi:MAG: sulfite exporter TauE/SafE family protein [Thermoanaerobaculia bacterium]|nr:sulfite exporter TauE/SafE family protein [Thermoanaerobaculia bacterium]
MTPLAWLGAALVGLALGLLGSGGSTLTVPILVYVVGLEEKTAIASSLAIVGSVALAGGLFAVARRRVDGRSVLWFGVPGMAGTAAGAQLARPVPGALQLVVFALFMLGAAALMWRGGVVAAEARRRSAWKLALDGVAVGVATGFVGIGGGFLIVPALVVVGGLPMPLAVGTSLIVIAMNAYVGFWRYLPTLAALGLTLDRALLAAFIAVGAATSLLGNRFGARLPQHRLRRLFAVTLVGLGLFVLARSLARLAG